MRERDALSESVRTRALAGSRLPSSITRQRRRLWQRTEAIFKKEERAREGTQAMLEYEAEKRAVREKTARLRALRLAAEASKEDARDKAAAKKA
jgi:hypothetical protein